MALSSADWNADLYLTAERVSGGAAVGRFFGDHRRGARPDSRLRGNGAADSHSQSSGVSAVLGLGGCGRLAARRRRILGRDKQALGLFHDDGIYTVVAKALSEAAVIESSVYRRPRRRRNIRFCILTCSPGSGRWIRIFHRTSFFLKPQCRDPRRNFFFVSIVCYRR